MAKAPLKSVTNRTPRSSSRRASRQLRPKPAVSGLAIVEAVERARRRALAREVADLGALCCIRPASS